jgi:hypothetical protein
MALALNTILWMPYTNQAILWQIPAGCPLMQSNSDTSYQEIASVPQGYPHLLRC